MRRVLVTGGTQGIGFAVAGHFLQRGDQVCIVGRDDGRVVNAYNVLWAVAEGRVSSIVTDVSERRALVKEAAGLLGGVPDIVVHAAGVNNDNLEDMLRTNVQGTWLLVSEAVTLMPAGSIILFSGGGVGGPAPGKDVSAFYTSSKAAVVQFAECMAAKHDHVRINAVAPGQVATQMTGWQGGPPDKAVQLIDWLCSDRASHVTGRLVSVRDGEVVWERHGHPSSVGRLRRESP